MNGMNEKLTPCEKLGYKVGDKFRVDHRVTGSVNYGDILTLIQDDGTECPYFSGSTRLGFEDKSCVYLYKLTPISQVTLTAADWTDSPPGKIEHLEEVHHPQHYTDGEIECIDAIKAALSPEEYKGFLKGNAMKYIWRMNRKGKPSVDAKKALWYTDKLCGELE